MKIKIKLMSCLFFFLSFIYMAIPPLSTELKVKNEMEKEAIVQVSSQLGEINVELEEYLVGVVAAEMQATFEIEALKAQAVAARTFVYSRNLRVDDTVNSQVYQQDDVLKEKWGQNYENYIKKVKQAVEDTKGEVLVYEGEIIHAFFFSSSNGKTNNSEDYWTTPYPYLKSVDSSFDEIKKDNHRTKRLSIEEINKCFDMKVQSMQILSLYENGYVKQVQVNDEIFSGKEVREKCGLSSSSFKVKLHENEAVFETLGSGHGVGMSQYGAQGMALKGYLYDEILKHYYQDVEIVHK